MLLNCCCGNANCYYCSDDVSSKNLQVTLLGNGPAGSCARLDGTYSVSSPADDLPWLDGGTTGTTATVQDIAVPWNVLTLPKYTTSGGVDTIDSNVCAWRFDSALEDYGPKAGSCTACGGDRALDMSSKDASPCDPLVADTCDEGFPPPSSACNPGGEVCDCLGFWDFGCQEDCTITGYSTDPDYVPCCTCVYDAGLADWFCSCTGTATGTYTVLQYFTAVIGVFVYRNSANDVVVYAYVIPNNQTLGNLQVYSGEHVFTGKTSLTCLSELDGLSITLTDAFGWIPDTSPIGSCLSGDYHVCDETASITLTLDLV